MFGKSFSKSSIKKMLFGAALGGLMLLGTGSAASAAAGPVCGRRVAQERVELDRAIVRLCWNSQKSGRTWPSSSSIAFRITSGGSMRSNWELPTIAVRPSKPFRCVGRWTERSVGALDDRAGTWSLRSDRGCAANF